MAKLKRHGSNIVANMSITTDSDKRSTRLLLSTLTSLETAVRSANDLPSVDSLEFACTTYPEINKTALGISSQILAALRSVGSRYDFAFGATETDSGNSESEVSAAAYDEVYEQISQVSEEILERFNVDLDAVRGIKNAVVPATGGIEPGLKVKGLREMERPKGGLGWVEMEKPQLKFPDYPIDNSDTPFVPPYGETADGADNVGSYLQDLYRANSNAGVIGLVGGKHPFDEEICAAAENMERKAFDEKDTMLFKELASTPCTFVDTDDVLFEMAEQLKNAVEIAVDIENHSMRSFQGFTCLIQFSTRRADFVVDALALRGSIHRALAPVFSDESTVKVMHGADKDVEWLERDFGIYVVNLFDTGQAARALNFPSCSLSHLLARFCSVVSPNKKKFQLADWRKRPLSKAMFEYARSDTHYLLYTYDRLRAELWKKEKLGEVWKKSAVVARRRHAKVRYDERMPRRLAAKHGLGFDRHQIKLFEELHRWRDRKAREEDESLHYVAPVKSLLGIVRARDHCKTVEGLLEKGFPAANLIPPLITANAKELATLITHTLESPLIDEREITIASGGKKKKKMKECMATNGNSEPREPDGSGLECDAKLEEISRAGDATEKSRVQSVTRKEQQVTNVKSCVHKKLRLDQDNCSKSKGPKQVLNGDTRLLDNSQGTQLIEDGQKMREKGPDLSHGEAVAENGKGTKERVVSVKLAGHSVFDFSSDEEEVANEEEEIMVRVGGQTGSRKNGGEVAVEDTGMKGTGDGSLIEKDMEIQGTVRERSKLPMNGDEEEGVRKTKEVMARVHAGMTHLGPVGPTEFGVEDGELDERASRDERPGKGQKRGRDEEVEEGEEKEVKSLSEIYGLRGMKRKKKRTKKNGANDSRKLSDMRTEESKEVATFDYRKMNNSSEVKIGKRPFDPLEKLRNDWKEKKSDKTRVRKPRKRPMSGVRSMSFKGKN